MSELLPEHLCIEMLRYLQYADIATFYAALTNVLSDATKCQVKQIYEQERLLYAFVDSPFPRSLLRRCSVLEFHQKFCPSGDYIDRIYPRDMADDVMIGRDKCNRPFIAVKYIIISGKHAGSTCVTIIFKRYIDSNEWVQAGHASPLLIGPLLSTQMTYLCRETKTECLDKIRKILNGEILIGFNQCQLTRSSQGVSGII